MDWTHNKEAAAVGALEPFVADHCGGVGSTGFPEEKLAPLPN